VRFTDVEVVSTTPWPIENREDAQAFEAFFRSTCARVVGLVAVVTGEVASAEDATQEAYVRAFRRWGYVRRLDRPDLWVVQVATRLAIDSWRRRRREIPLTPGVPASVPDEVQRLWVRWGLERLSARQRAAVVLHHLQGLGVAEVAATVDVSPETIKTHVQRALHRLRKLLREDDEQ